MRTIEGNLYTERANYIYKESKRERERESDTHTQIETSVECGGVNGVLFLVCIHIERENWGER